MTSEQRLYGPDGGPRKPARFSQCSKILAVLEDGRWHTTAELYRRVGGCVLHSRIAELRKRGFPVEHEYIPGKSGAQGSKYRLALSSSPDHGGSAPRPSAVVTCSTEREQTASGSVCSVGGSGVTSDPVAPEQLTLEAA